MTLNFGKFPMMPMNLFFYLKMKLIGFEPTSFRLSKNASPLNRQYFSFLYFSFYIKYMRALK